MDEDVQNRLGYVAQELQKALKDVAGYAMSLRENCSAGERHVEVEVRSGTLLSSEFERVVEKCRTVLCPARIEEVVQLDVIDDCPDGSKIRHVFLTKPTIGSIVNNTSPSKQFIPDRKERLKPLGPTSVVQLETLPGFRLGWKIEEPMMPLLPIAVAVTAGRGRVYRLKERTRFVMGHCYVDCTKVKQTDSAAVQLMSTTAGYVVEMELHRWDPDIVPHVLPIIYSCYTAIRMNISYLVPTADGEKQLMEAYKAEKTKYLSAIAANPPFYREDALLSPKLAAALLEPCRGSVDDYSITAKYDGLNANLFIQHEVIEEWHVGDKDKVSVRSRTYLCLVFHRLQKLLLYPLLALEGDPFQLDGGSILLNGEWMIGAKVFIPFDVYIYGRLNAGQVIPCHRRRMDLWTESARETLLMYYRDESPHGTAFFERCASLLNQLVVTKPFQDNVRLVITDEAEEKKLYCLRTWLNNDELESALTKVIMCDGYVLTPKWETPDFTNPVAWMQNYKIKQPEHMTVDVKVQFLRKQGSSHKFETAKYSNGKEAYVCRITPSIVSELDPAHRIEFLYITPQEKRSLGIYDNMVAECCFYAYAAAGTTSTYALQVKCVREDKTRGNQERTLGQIFDYIRRYGAKPPLLSQLPIFLQQQDPCTTTQRPRCYYSPDQPSSLLHTGNASSFSSSNRSILADQHNEAKWDLIRALIHECAFAEDPRPVDEPLCWLDIGAGRGGDIHKWKEVAQNLHPPGRQLHVVAVEPSQSIFEAMSRFCAMQEKENTKCTTIKVTWVHCTFEDFVEKHIAHTRESEGKDIVIPRFHIITFMHSIHYLYSNHPILNSSPSPHTERFRFILYLIRTWLAAIDALVPCRLLLMSMDANACSAAFSQEAQKEAGRYSAAQESAFAGAGGAEVGPAATATWRPIVLAHYESSVPVIRMWRQSERQWLVKLDQGEEAFPEWPFTKDEIAEVVEETSSCSVCFFSTFSEIPISSLYFGAMIRLE
jgi:hypothetical protein